MITAILRIGKYFFILVNFGGNMLKGVYSFKNLDLDIAQAYIAIVLDYHSQYKAAERVLNFYKYVSSDENEVTVIREKKYLEYLALAKKQKKSFLATVIHDMYNNKVLDNGRNRNNSLANKVSLLDLNVNISEKEIYNDVMILQTSQEHILIHYMRTHTFFVQFRKWLKNKYPKDKFNRPNNFTDAKCKELLNPVITRCRNYFTNNFNKSSIGLDDYIFKALNMYFKDSPDKDGNYDKKSEVNEFFEIMNRHGQDREVSGSDADSSTTALNFVGIDFRFRARAVRRCAGRRGGSRSPTARCSGLRPRPAARRSSARRAAGTPPWRVVRGPRRGTSRRHRRSCPARCRSAAARVPNGWRRPECAAPAGGPPDPSSGRSGA